MPYSPGSLPTDPAARRAAHDFAALVGRVVNTTIAQVPIGFYELPRADFEGYVTYAQNKAPAPMPLSNGCFLYLFQRVGLRREERYLTTLEYRYQYQQTENDESWIWRYEYQREPPERYPYPRSHVHVNASPEAYPGGKPYPNLHMPTGGRVTVEDIVRHLLMEHEVPAVSPNYWQDVLKEASGAFDEIQRRRLAEPA